MRYDNPELREALAAEYVLGTMPGRARRRFERLMASDPSLARTVEEWAERFAPIDAAMPEQAPPTHLWSAIERRTGAPSAPPTPHWLYSLGFWRTLAAAASAAAVALAVYVGAFSNRNEMPSVVAVLTGHSGTAGWVAVAGPRTGEVSFSAVEPAAESKPRDFELWGIAGAAPRALGLLPGRAGASVTLKAKLLPPPGASLAVSLEPPGGSPTGAPTGPVLYQGKVLTRSP